MKTKKLDNKRFYGTVKVSERGQIAIPLELRDELDIRKGDILLVGKKADNKGIVLIKMEVIEEVFNLQEDVFS
jgi:AbrB family looped-hinge helix DNA binding protein